jgi:hypothetical protein
MLVCVCLCVRACVRVCVCLCVCVYPCARKLQCVCTLVVCVGIPRELKVSPRRGAHNAKLVKEKY